MYITLSDRYLSWPREVLSVRDYIFRSLAHASIDRFPVHILEREKVSTSVFHGMLLGSYWHINMMLEASLNTGFSFYFDSGAMIRVSCVVILPSNVFKL